MPWDLEGQISGPGATDQATPGRNAYPLADLMADLQLTAELALPRAGWAGVVVEAFTSSLLVDQGGLSGARRTGHTKPPPIGFGRRILRRRTIGNLVFAVKLSSLGNLGLEYDRKQATDSRKHNASWPEAAEPSNQRRRLWPAGSRYGIGDGCRPYRCQ